MKNLNTRRSIRKYADKPVSDELLNRLMTEAARTQTMGNLQLYSVIVTRTTEMKEKLSPAHFNQPMVKEAPVCSPSAPTSTAPVSGPAAARQNLAMTISCRSSTHLPMPCSIHRPSAISWMKRDSVTAT